MKTLTNRRDILKSSMAVAAALLIPKTNAFASIAEESTLISKNKSFLAKHGNFITENNYLWSVMKVANENSFLASVDKILRDHKYYTKLAYSSNDKFKVDPAKNIIDLILHPKTGVSFQMTYLNSNPNIFSHLSPSALNQKKSSIYSKVLSNSGHAQHLVSKAEDRFGPSTAYSNKFRELHGASFEAIDAKSNLLIQVNDLISGICYSVLSSKPLHSSVKKEINAYFVQKSKLKNLSDQKISLINITITKTTIA